MNFVVNDNIRSLRNLGFTEYDILVYGGLVSLGKTTANEISSLTEVPYPKVYAVLKNLGKMGLVEIYRGRPMKFRARYPREALTSLRENLMKNIDDSVRKALTELEPIFQKIAWKEERGVWNIVGKRNVINKSMELIETCQKRLWIAFPNLDTLPSRSMIPGLDSAKQREVDIKILGSEEDATEALHYKGKADIRLFGDINTRYVLVDNEVLMFSISRSTFGPESWSAVWSKCENLVIQSEEHFRLAWKYGKQIY